MDGKDRLVLLHGPEMPQIVIPVDRVEQLVAGGASRLTAQRIVEIERGTAEAGRARRHTLSR
jgi:hypothetical protein